MLACSQAAVRKWLHQRRLPSVKVGRLTRIRARDVEAFVRAGRGREIAGSHARRELSAMPAIEARSGYAGPVSRVRGRWT